jgi:predicted component of type VI protein secretion system
LWDKIESTNWNKQNTSEHNPLKKALASYEFSDNAEHALNNMTRTEIDTMILHEQGEALAGRQLEPEWANMLNDAGRSKAEIIIRAVRDLLADCLITLPTLLENHHTLALYGYFSHFSGMRKTLFPMLDKAYQHWQTHNTLQPLNHAISTGQKHWLNTATQLLDIYQTQHSQWHKHIGNLESTIICH